MEQKKILLAEGEPSMREFYENALEREGYRVVCASTSAEALAKLESERPDLVVLDLRIPGGGGLETLNRIFDHPEVPPVVLTSGSPVWEESFLIWNADACVAKSFDLTELKEAIEDAFDRQAVRRWRRGGSNPLPELEAAAPPGSVKSVHLPRSREVEA